jgi:hypothetical protein
MSVHTSQIDLDDIASELNRATRYENYVVACCPFHDDSRPSFFVYDDYFRCESCGEQGHPNKLLEHLNLVPILHKTAPNFKNPWTTWLRDRSLAKTLKFAWEKGPSVYMRKRGIDDKTQKRLGIGILENYITFPARSKEKRKIIGAIARAGEGRSGTKYVIPSGQDPHLLYSPSWERIEKRKTIYLTFGIIDAISLHVMGAAAISTTCGMRMDISYLDDIRKQIIFIPDRGEEKEAQKFASKMGWRGKVMRCNYPEGAKDVNDIMLSEHKHELQSVLDVRNSK